MRIASNTIAEALARSVARQQTDYATEQIRIASGKKIQRRSEDCLNASLAADLQRGRALNAQTTANLQAASTWVLAGESRLGTIVDQMARAREIAVEAGDATRTADAQRAMVQELDGILEDLLRQANAQQEGARVFGGVNGDEPPITAVRGPDGRIVSVSYADTSDVARSIQIEDGVVISYGTCATGTRGVFADAGTGRDLFQSLIDLRDGIAAGSSPSEPTLAALTAAFDGATEALMQTGLQGNRLQGLVQQAKDVDAAMQERVTELNDTDLVKSISRLGELEAALQASMRMAAALGRFSLADYL